MNLYYGRINASLDAFETLSSAFVRAVPGALSVSLTGKEEGVHVDTRRLTSGVEGVQRLCKALLSAKYIGVSMERWGEELVRCVYSQNVTGLTKFSQFFLELWTEINQEPSLRARASDNPLLPDPTTQGELPSNTLFDELISRYGKIVSRTEDMIIQQMCGEVESALKVHFSMATSSVASFSSCAVSNSAQQTRPKR
jgi:RAD50-interacting protein 1